MANIVRYVGQQFQGQPVPRLTQKEAPINIQLPDTKLKELAFHPLTLPGFPFHTISFE